MQEVILKNGSKVFIRPMRGDDYESARLFLRQITQETIFTNQYPGQPDIDKEKSISLYENQKANCFIGTFTDEGRLIAVASFSITHFGNPWSGRNCTFGITILKEFCGLGLGTILMQVLENEARQRNMHRIEGQVRSKNRQAIALYLKRGFEIDGHAKETAFINGEWHDEYHISKILD